MKILSVDFDHFLPDWSSFDWGQSELDPRLFGEHVWAMRACNRGPDGPAHETIVPRGHIGFWDRVLDDIPPVKLVVVDSHSVMNDILADLKRNRATPVEVVNVDAHHDMGYGVKDDSPNPPDCANWAWYGLTRKQISKYTVVYPRWRQSCPEGFARSRPHRARASSTTLLPEKQYYGMVVVCRSSAWTPTWCDQEWMKFIGWWGQPNKKESQSPDPIQAWNQSHGYYVSKTSVAERRGNGDISRATPITDIKDIREIEADLAKGQDCEFVLLFHYQLLREEDDGKP